jgi:hypothetical protein
LEGKWSNAPKSSENLVRQRSGKHDKLEEVLFLWFSDVRAQNACITDKMLIEKAKKFGSDLGIAPDFQYSQGWLQRFKKRHTISHYIAHGEASSADMENVTLGRAEMKDTLSGIDPVNIYNLDETGLFFRLEPNSTLATGPIRGKKKKKDRLTASLCVNATGTDKVRPLVIGKAANPRCFGRNFDPTVYVDYQHNKKAWMTTGVFQEWLSSFDRRMRLKGRHVILLVDNATSHSTDGMRLTNVTVKFLRPNTTSHIQPMDAGIIRNFKAYYRNLTVLHFLDCIERNEDQAISVRLALSFIKQAWVSVKQTTIVNCWRHVNILPDASITPADEDDDEDHIPLAQLRRDDDDIPLAQLRNLLQRMPPEHRMEAEEYISVDNNVEVCDSLTDDAILEIVSENLTPKADSDSEEESSCDVDIPVSKSEARAGLMKTIKFLEQNSSVGTNHLDNAWQVMSVIDSFSATHIQKSIMDFIVKK